MNMDWNRPIPNPATLRQLLAEYLGRHAAGELEVDSRFAAAHYQDGRDLRTPGVSPLACRALPTNRRGDMEFCIDAAQLRAALAEIEAAEKNGFLHCLAVFKFSHAGYMLSDCRATYADLLERAHPTSASLNWGRFQGVSKRHTFKDGELVPLPADGVPASAPTQREKDLALLVKRLCRRLAPDDNLREGTTDYLRREGLLGSPLRADESGVKEDGNG